MWHKKIINRLVLAEIYSVHTLWNTLNGSNIALDTEDSAVSKTY